MSKALHPDKLVLVTGGAGFIGSGLIRLLNDEGFANIVIVDDVGRDVLSCEKWKNMVGKRVADVVPIAHCFDYLQGRHEDIQAILHMGANSSTVERDGDFLIENNTRFSVRLAEYALRYEIRFIYASSAATYGDGTQEFSDDHAVIDTLRPLNMYGFSKHLFDQWALRQGVLDQVVGLKYFNVFGPNEGHKGRMASAVLKMVPQIEKEGKISLFKSNDPDQFADGEQKRDFIYVKDAARMTLAFLAHDVGGIFNVGTGYATSWNQLARAVFKALNKPEKIEYIPMPEDLAGKYQNYTRADTRKMQSHPELDMSTMPIEKAVADYIQNYLLTGERW